MGLIQSGALLPYYFSSGIIDEIVKKLDREPKMTALPGFIEIASGSLHAFHFASGTFVGASGVALSITVSGQIVIGLT